jgi:glycosyltransferase involved in cell wall biosynthesis
MEHKNGHREFRSNGNHSDVFSKTTPDDYPIIVHSHLNWDWVWQRPQQFISRLSKRHRILFVEGPTPSPSISSTEKTLCEVSGYPNVLVLQTRVPAKRWPDGEWVDQERRRIVQQMLAEPLGREFQAPVQWFYDPMAVVAFAGHLHERAIVYDCMDELSLFRGAPPELVRRERELLTLADIVFAGGPQIWDAKRKLNPNCFCFGCGVDKAHFAKARQPGLPLPPEVENLPQPVFGYIGVVDERLDYDLLAHLADATSGSVVIVGPRAKVDSNQFPRRKNLHWLGARSYSELPDYARSFAVCLMPFAMNEATRFINPTKALEYMATGRPIVSTPIADVVRQFRDVVYIAGSNDDFITTCNDVARLADAQRIQKGLTLAARNSWESIVAQLERHVEVTLASKFDLNINAA